jgi:hypothetical protein
VNPKELKAHQSSFRDPAGFVFEQDNVIYRQVNQAGADDYEHFMKSGLYKKLAENNLLIEHQEVKNTSKFGTSPKRYKIIRPVHVPFISYPYEWTFHQLKDAALLTLKVQKIALEHGMILKDASAYNVQFIGRKPVFIDTLSLWKYTEGDPWEGYKQFCEHFVAPLALAAYATPEILQIQKVFIDGVPLKLATQLLPSRARLKKGLLAHIYLHAASQKKYDKPDVERPNKARRVSPMALNGLMASLQSTVKKLSVRRRETQWGDYYNDTNYSEDAFENKKKVVKQLLKQITPTPKTVWDMGANDGTFSDIAAEMGAHTIAFDMDSLAVEQNYKKNDPHNELILPLVQDLANPSPALGWAHNERHSLEERGPADVVLALALIHHLAITGHSPFSQVADYFSKLGKYLIIEFVPKDDSKVQLLLAGFSRNTFSGYSEENFEKAFAKFFKLVDKKHVSGSKRDIYLYESKSKKS